MGVDGRGKQLAWQCVKIWRSQTAEDGLRARRIAQRLGLRQEVLGTEALVVYVW